MPHPTPPPTTPPPGRFACVYCNQSFHFSSDLDDHKCALAPTPAPSLPSLPSVEKLSEQKAAKEEKENPLVPCPWCKVEPDIEVGYERVQIICRERACPVNPHLVHEGADAEHVALARADWNSVTPPAAPAAKPLAAETDRALQALRARLPMAMQNALAAWVMMRRRKRFPVSVALVNKWSRFLAAQGEAAFIAALIHSTTEEYRALVPAPREAQAPKAAKKGADHALGF